MEDDEEREGAAPGRNEPPTPNDRSTINEGIYIGRDRTSRVRSIYNDFM